MDDISCYCRSPVAGFLSRLMALVKIALFIAGIVIVFAGAVFCRAQYNRASDAIEATYWYIRYWGFLLGVYAIILFFAVVFYINSNHSVFGFMDYWPAACMVWTDNSWFGESHHEIALMYEIFLIGFLGFVVNGLASIYGEYDWDLERFTPSRLALRQWFEQEIESLQKTHPGSVDSFNTYPRHGQEAMIAKWNVAHGKRYEWLMRQRQRLLR